MAINTFQPWFGFKRRFKRCPIRDWFLFKLEVNNCVCLEFTVYGYGFWVGARIWEPKDD